jgi:hypothetical protein
MQDELDKLIDNALATYSAAEPLAGLDQRVLNRVRERRTRWPWLLAIPAVAAAILVAVQIRKADPVPVATFKLEAVHTPASRTPPPEPSRDLSLDRKGVVGPHGHRVVSKSAPAPKRRLFPTLSPLTEQERLLVQLAQSYPQELLIRSADRIEIKPIEIAPLQIDGTQDGRQAGRQ